MASVYIGLGSNLGNRNEYLLSAVEMIIEETSAKLISASSVLETEAVDYTDQPDFLNQVILVDTPLQPHELLKALKDIENRLGRVKRFEKGPREIDLDILLYDTLVLNTGPLVIPHPEIVNRIFVLQHLVELNPELEDPVTGERFYSILEKLNRGRGC